MAADAREVRNLFARITPRYDFLNHLLSLNLDRRWRNRLVDAALARRPVRILDLACGTGDLALAFRRRASTPLVIGADFCGPMLAVAREKSRRCVPPVAWTAADALALPFADGAFDLVAVAFGIRNFSDLDAGLAEIRRVAAPGGTFLALEFSEALASPFDRFYRPYFRYVLPRLGRWISGSDAYAHLVHSVERFPPPAEVAARLRAAGFARVAATPLCGGAVVLYSAGGRP